MKRMIVVTVAWIVVGVGAFGWCERQGWLTEGQVYGWLAASGWQGAATGVLLLLGDVMLPVPSSVVMTLHGVVYGAGWGTLYSVVGSLGAAWIGYGLGRMIGQESVARVGGSPEELSHAERFFARFGPYAVMLSRPVPLFAEVVTCLAGMNGLSPWRFGFASLCGTLPLCAVYAVWGARGGAAGLLLPTLVMAVMVPVLGWGVLAWGHSRRKA